MNPDPDGWHRLLRRVRAQHEALVDDFLARLRELGTYRAHGVPHEDLRRTARDTIELLLLRLAGDEVPERLIEVPRRLGERRARQGVAREDLLEAVRLDHRVLWAALVRELGDEPADLLVRHAERLLTEVEAYIGDVQQAFLLEQAALARDTRIEASRGLSRLLAARERAAATAAQVAPALGMALDATFEVACVSEADSPRARAELGGLSPLAVWDYDDATVFVHQLPGTSMRALLSAPGSIVEDVRGLAAVPDAARAARALQPCASGPGLADERALWLPLARARLADALPTTAQDVAEGLADLPPDAAARMLETVRAFARTGSIKATGEALFLHRNTIVNRLAAFRDRTGLDMTVPEQAALALVLLA